MRLYFSLIISVLLLTSCVAPGKIYSETTFFSDKCLTCKNRENGDLGICFKGHQVKYTENDSSEILSVVIPRPTQYKYNEFWLVAKNHRSYYIIPLNTDSIALYSFRKPDKFKSVFSNSLIPDSLMIE